MSEIKTDNTIIFGYLVKVYMTNSSTATIIPKITTPSTFRSNTDISVLNLNQAFSMKQVCKMKFLS